MNIAQFFRKRKCLSFREGTGGVTGVRQAVVRHFFDTPVAALNGPFPRNLIVFMYEGAGAFRRDGETSLVEAGGTLVVQAGAGSLQFIASKLTQGFCAHIVEFDARSVAGHLRKSHRTETRAIEAGAFPTSGVVLPDVHVRCFPAYGGVQSGLFHSRATFDTIFRCWSSLTAPLSRSIFYEDRWELLRFLEPHVWMPLADLTWREKYGKGVKQLVRDCRHFIGCTPEVFMRRRKMELASAWLRCQRPVEEIARVLGFSSAWEFQCMYGATTKRRCTDVAAETPLWLMSADELHEAIAPFYWSPFRPETSELPEETERLLTRGLAEAVRRAGLADADIRWAREKPWERLFEATARKPPEFLSEMMSDEDVANMDAASPFRRYSAADRLRLLEDFMEMKTTAAEIVVPFFKDAPMRSTMAA